ncbi:YggS family pyridoxal phosphate-dependent enzyme [Methanococcoides methylutens]|uniref:YggS family pyridoxal phosphate-dependent enzyme n=1 Tax=Methanococcoides methylutens TaxID=2226 RepID=UPI0040449DE8
MTVEENTKAILEELGEVKLVSVTKTIDTDRINESIKAGATIIGENRVQEFDEKCDCIPPCEKHLIGHLQTNKVKRAVELFDVIQSVDSLKVAEEIDSRAEEIGKVQKVFLQVNIGNEPQKYGFGTDEIAQAIKDIQALKNVHVKGLMCIPPFVSPEEARPYFRNMKAIFDEMKQANQGNIDIKELSMGMSGDYKVAIEEGATMVRIGSGIFGKRDY